MADWVLHTIQNIGEEEFYATKVSILFETQLRTGSVHVHLRRSGLVSNREKRGNSKRQIGHCKYDSKFTRISAGMCDGDDLLSRLPFISSHALIPLFPLIPVLL